ncbi:MAG: lipid-A-disaccharide synthase [Cycloclasticus sp. symbiont of Poecilosclerida sp. N]|nr:MAG: lipid-A-disaccharide synthase [Cycloclasticus sp. symbiont of Poecilosclerida sp. N]
MMVAGEHSGDILGVCLMKRLKEYYPNIVFAGIGGQRMESEGFISYYPMSKLSVFGLFEVLKHLPELLGIRRNLRKSILHENPDVFIGIDAPDFNLKLENDLYQKGIKTVHYVSPTVWAWRPKRIKKLINSLNALLCIFPFEEEYFKNTPVPAHFIGHPLADEYEDHEGTLSARKELLINPEAPVLTMMPGSRLGELERHSLIFLETAQRCSNEITGLKVLVPLPDSAAVEVFRNIYEQSGIKLDLEIKEMAGKTMIAASDMVLVASGTATLEAMLLKKPMVVAYKLSALTTWVFRAFDLLKAPYVSMPNLIAGKGLVKEYLHEEMTTEALTKELLRLHQTPEAVRSMEKEFTKMATKLTRDASTQAAKIVIRIIEGEN